MPRTAVAGTLIFLLSVVLALPAQAPQAATGSLRGVVRFTAAVPEPRKILTTDGATILHSDLVVDAKTKGLRSVFVILEDAPEQPKVAKAAPVVVDQRDMIFQPRVVAVQHGQAVRFENNDLCNHCVQSNSIKEGNQFNLIAGPNQPIERILVPQKTPVQIGCSLHTWMRAWVYVVPHPWFAVTDAAGTFRVENVPPGKYTLMLVHPDTNHRERRTVEIQAGQTAELTITWDKLQP